MGLISRVSSRTYRCHMALRQRETSPNEEILPPIDHYEYYLKPECRDLFAPNSKLFREQVKNFEKRLRFGDVAINLSAVEKNNSIFRMDQKSNATDGSTRRISGFG